MKWHPDRHESIAAKGEADRRFKILAAAYKILRDPTARAKYDRELEHKLRGEYDGRRQEQDKREEAENAQARHKQTWQDDPRHESAGAGSQFEEETVSGEDVDKMFFEQMLDLAFELAGRGFPEANICRALTALGCPESMARAVASLATKQRPASGNAQAAVRSEAPPIEGFDKASWEELEPYYAAAVTGTSARVLLSEAAHGTIQTKIRKRSRIGLGLGLVVLAIGFLERVMNFPWP